MRPVEDLEVGVMFWAGRDTLGSMMEMGVHCGQLGIAGEIDLTGAAARWRADLERESFALVTVFCAYIGESYADIPTVQRTVGFIPPETRAEREARTIAVSNFAAAVGVSSIACHIGFVPEDDRDPDYVAVRDMVRRVCDHAAANRQSFALETGQEPAQVLLRFIHNVDRPNLGINFDPANMILYGTGDPIEALDVLAPKLLSVHCKDGDWPPRDQPDALGTEKPLGEGSVGMEQFVRKLKQVGFRGSLNIEREAEDQATRLADMRRAVPLLQRLRG